MNVYELSFFKGFTKEEVNSLLKLMFPTTYAPGEAILKEGESSHLLMIILDGRVKIIKKIDNENFKVLAILEKGEIFGEMSFFDDGIHNASAISHTTTNVLVLSKNDFDVFAEKNPLTTIKFLKKVIQTCSNRIRNLNEEIKEVSNWCLTLRKKNQ